MSVIAERVGRTRESVRLVADDKRGPGGFPAPLGVVRDGTRVWPWSVVPEWFNDVLAVDLEESGVPSQAAPVLDVSFAARRSPGLGAALGRTWLA